MCRMYIAVCLVAFFACCYAAPNKYIIGGEVVQDIKAEFPYQVSVQWGDFGSYYHICGGAIIDKNFVITAYHCCNKYDKQKLFVVAGENNVEINKENIAKLITVKEKKWIQLNTVGENEFERDDDLCLLKVDHVFLDDMIINIDNAELDDTILYTLTGWGVSEISKGMPTEKLMKSEGLKILPRKEQPTAFDTFTKYEDNTCEKQLLKIGFSDTLLEEDNICTFNNDGKTVCNGDSGGPLVYTTTESGVTVPHLVGIVSWGIAPCGRNDVPNIYTHLAKYVGKIDEAKTELNALP